MEPLNEWFSPEQLEEQIDTQLRGGPQLTANEQLLHDLQHVTQEDTQSLERIRMRLLAHALDNSERPPVPIQLYQQRQHGQMGLSEQWSSHSGTKRMSRPLQLAMGLVALLVIGSMLGVFMQIKSHQLPQVTTQSPTSTIASNSSVQIHGKAAFVLDATTGKVLVNINSHARLQFTGTPRIMTALVALENSNLDQQITITQSMLQETTQGTSDYLLDVGDTLTLHDLIYALLISNANDVAMVIAHAIAGNIPDFVTQMNNEAHKLQLNDTHFSSPYGTPTKDDYSSAADLVNLTKYALQRNEFAQAFATVQYSIAATKDNHAYTWSSGAPTANNIIGANYGYNIPAGASIVFSSHRSDGQVLIGAEIGAPSVSILMDDVKLLSK